MKDVPWLPHLATEFLEARILPRWCCFEWGSGGSTRWLAARCQHVVSVEHDERWMDDYPSHVELLLVPPEPFEVGSNPGDPTHYKSGSTEMGKVNFKRYCHTIDEYDVFDLVLVDGRARASCIALAVGHVRPGGWLVVDNTGDRLYYLEKNMHLFVGWEQVIFYGRGPKLGHLWETTMFRRPAE